MKTEIDTNNEAKAKMIALFGGAQIQVLYEDGTAEDVRVRQLRLVEYTPALNLIGDEFAITAFCSSLNATPTVPCKKEFVLRLQPQSYEALFAKVQEVNKDGFFYYVARRQAEEDATNGRLLRQAAELPPEVLAAAIERGKSLLPTSSLRPRAVPG